MELNRIYNENCISTMGRMPDDFIDLTITSPPYDSLRTYNGFTFEFEKIAAALYRVTKQGGVVVWVVGDESIDGGETGTSFRQALFFQSLGFLIHDTMIYEKNGASYPANDKSVRYSQTFEYMFVFSKGSPKTHNLLKDKKNRWAGYRSFGQTSYRNTDGGLKVKEAKREISEFGYRTNIWKFNNGAGYSTKDEIAFEHPAIFPEALAHDHMYSWSNEGDLIYDPFGGSGTVGKIAHEFKRNWILSEISDEYCAIAEKRISKYIQSPKLF